MTILIQLSSGTTLFRQGLNSLIDNHPDIELVKSAACKNHCSQECFNPDAEVMIIDISNGQVSRLNCIRQITAKFQSAKVLALINVDIFHLINDILDDGAMGVISLNADAAELIEAIKTVSRGETYIEPALAQVLTEMSYNKTNNPFNALSKRERILLTLILHSHSNDSCANTLNISKKTVANHYSRIKSKLKVDNRVQLTRLAMRHKFIIVD